MTHGPIISPPGQYTHCVDRKDYKDVPGILSSGIPATLEFLLCDYLLGGKLVCLAGGGDECGIGVVVGARSGRRRQVGHRGAGQRLLVQPALGPLRGRRLRALSSRHRDPTKFEAHKIRDDVAAHSPLGWLMLDNATATSPLPTPREPSSPPAGTSPVDGYGVLYSMQNSTLVFDHENQNNLHKLWEHSHDGSAVSIPILHCECEGSRIFFVCQAMKPFIDLMQGKIPGCGAEPGGGLPCPSRLGAVGIGKAVCTLIEDIVGGLIGLAIWPAALATFATAWEAAQAFDDLFVTGPIADQIHVGDTVVVTGRWVWDAGHAGHCEFHPVKTIQKITMPSDMRGPYVPADPLPAGQRRAYHGLSPALAA